MTENAYSRRMRFAARAVLAIAVLVTTSAVPAFVACASFDEGNPTPSAGQDAADAENDATAASDGPFTVDSQPPACEAEAMGPIEAGPESTACLAGGGNVDLLTSDEHCGFCGNVCTPATCSQGACRAVDVLPAADFATFSDSTDGTNLYFATGTGGCGASTVHKMALAGGSPPQVSTVLSENAGCIHWTGIRNGRLYYNYAPVGILETSVDQPKSSEKTLFPSNDVQGVHLASDRLFLLIGDGAVVAVPLDGAAKVTIHDDAALKIIAFVGDGDAAWWVTLPRAEAGTAEGTLRTRRVGDPNTTFRATGLYGISRIAVDETYVYFASVSGDVHRLRKDNGGDAELVTRIDVVNHSPRALAVVGDYLYVAVGDVNSFYNGSFELYRAKKCGGRARLLTSDYMVGSQVFPFGDWLYFSGGRVARLPITKR